MNVSDRVAAIVAAATQGAKPFAAAMAGLNSTNRVRVEECQCPWCLKENAICGDADNDAHFGRQPDTEIECPVIAVLVSDYAMERPKPRRRAAAPAAG